MKTHIVNGKKMSNSIKKLIERLKFRQRGSTVEGKLNISLFFPLYLYKLRTKAKSSNQNPSFLRSIFFLSEETIVPDIMFSFWLCGPHPIPQ